MNEIIPIIKDSVKRNPDEGSMFTMIPVDSRIDFKYIHDYRDIFALPKIFEFDNKTPGIHINSVMTTENIYEVRGCVDHIDILVSLLPEELFNKVKINQEIKYHKIHHAPISEFEYQHDMNTKVECEECGHEIKVKDILEDEDSDDNLYQKCPLCSAINSFNYSFEKFIKNKFV